MLGDYNPQIVLLSFAISFLGAYVAISACEQLRGIHLKYSNPPFLMVLPWLTLAGVAVGGVAIWSMHFIGMAALSLQDSLGNTVSIGFNIGVSIFSIFAAILAVIIGLIIASRDKVFAKSKAEIMEFFIVSVSLEQILEMSEFQVLFLLATRSLHQLALGGTVAGSGVVIMHYIGMAAIEFHGSIHWNAGIVAASIIIAVVVATVGFWIFFRLLSIYPDSELLRILSAIVVAIAVCGMHYTGMVAADFEVSDTEENRLNWSTGTMGQQASLYPVLFGALTVLWIFTLVIFADLRFKVSKYRQYLQKLSPNEKLSILLLTAENSLGEEGGEQGKAPMLASNAVAPSPFVDDDSPI